MTDTMTGNTRRWEVDAPTRDAPPIDAEIRIGGKSYLSPVGLARILGISTRTLARWEDARIGPPRIRVGRLVLYDVDRIPEWLERHESAPVRLGVSKFR